MFDFTYLIFAMPALLRVVCPLQGMERMKSIQVRNSQNITGEASVCCWLPDSAMWITRHQYADRPL